jgi:hypothetical protein
MSPNTLSQREWEGRQTCLYRGEQQGDCECAQCRRRNSESSPASHHAEARRQKQNGTCCDNPWPGGSPCNSRGRPRAQCYRNPVALAA